MLVITEYNYFKPAAGVPAERRIDNPSLDYERNKKSTIITVIADIVTRSTSRVTPPSPASLALLGQPVNNMAIVF